MAKLSDRSQKISTQHTLLTPIATPLPVVQLGQLSNIREYRSLHTGRAYNCSHDRVQFTDEQFYQLCLSNPELTIERDAEGRLIVMSPVGGDSGNREMDLGGEVYIWNRQTQLGKVFSSSTLFKLPGGGDRSPDVAWVELSRWQALTPEQRQKFPPIAPDFVIELRSRSDSLQTLQDKMLEYLQSGVRLGWLFNPQNQQVEIYRQEQTKEVRSLPTQLFGEDVLPGFVLNVSLFSD